MNIIEPFFSVPMFYEKWQEMKSLVLKNASIFDKVISYHPPKIKSSSFKTALE